jgi:adenylate cyclase
MNPQTKRAKIAAETNWTEERERRKRVRRHSDFATLGANAIGAILAQLYFIINGSFESSPDIPAAIRNRFMIVTVIGIAALLLLGKTLGDKHDRPLKDWYLSPRSRQEPPSKKVQRDILNGPLHTAMMSLAMWVLAGLFFGTSTAFTTGGDGIVFDGSTFTTTFLSLTGLSGTISATLVYFINERIRQPEIPVFFPDGEVSQMQSFRMTIRRRVFVLFIIQAIPLVILAVVAYQNALEFARTGEASVFIPRLRQLEIFIVGVGVLAALTLAFTLGVSLIQGVEALNRHMESVRHGDLNVTMPVTSNDELGQLAEGFNAMVQGLQKEQVIRHLFSVYVTPEVAEHAIEYGAELGGQLATATVLFTDIRDFTALSEHTPPDVLITMLNRYLQAMTDVVNAHEGIVNKFGGDSLLAVFGTPLKPASDPAQRAVDTARDMLHALQDFNVAQGQRDEPALRIGIGIATGPVIAGNVGGQERLEYTVIGDPVNLASRLETLTKSTKATVLIDGPTTEALPQSEFTPMGDIDVRGKEKPVPVYTLTSHLAKPSIHAHRYADYRRRPKEME